jgi:hypothetical protein
MPLRTVTGLIIIVIFIAVFVYFFWPYISTQHEIYDPFSEKTRLVRNYACSMAICTLGCGDPRLGNPGLDECSGGTCICIKRNSGTGKCERWCQDVCEEKNWPDGKHCGEDYSIDFTFEMPVELKGAYDIRGTDDGLAYYWKTEIVDIINFLNKTEHFTGIDDILWGNIWRIIGEYYRDKPCSERPTPSYQSPDGKGYVAYAYGLGIINRKDAKFRQGGTTFSEIEGGGDIFLDPIEAQGLYNCYQSNIVGTFGPHQLGVKGYYSCPEFTGSLKMWSSQVVENGVVKQPGCADVFFKGERTSTGDFVFWPEPETKLIPIEQEGSFDLNITNNYEHDESFDLEIKEVDGVDCKFEGDQLTSTLENVPKGETGEKLMTCRPVSSKQNSYIVVITAKAKTSGLTRSTEVNIIVTDFSIDIKPDRPQTVSAGDRLVYTVEIKNKLGDTAEFNLALQSDTGAGCTLADSKLSITNGETKMTEMTCIPTSNGAYEVTVEASYNELKHSDKVEIAVPSCHVNSLDLKFFKGGYEIIPSEVNSGEDFTMQVGGFTDCQDALIDFYVNPSLYVGNCKVDSTGYRCTSEKTANTPGTYNFSANITLNGVDYKASKNITIKKPVAMTDDCQMRSEWCAFALGAADCNGAWPGGFAEICDKCGAWYSVEDCKNYGDPQSCYMDPVKTCASASNVCCIYDSDSYSSGPKDGPSCLSPDTNTHNDRTRNLWYIGVDNARNILVQDRKYATFKYDDCNSNDDCTGKSGGNNPPSLLSSALCEKNRCKLSDSLPTYTSWLYIRISETSRPVYGIALRGENVGGCGGFSVFLHDNNGWFNLGNAYLNQWIRFTSSAKWSYDNVDSVLIAKNDNCNPRFTSSIDYIGLLTKDEMTPFCNYGAGTVTRGNPDYNRTVDDGKSCYWGLDCPRTNSRGWQWKERSTFIGPLSDVGCDCSSGSCGNGFCEFSIEGETFCYYDVKCIYGGWNANLVKCEPGKCKYDGCE